MEGLPSFAIQRLKRVRFFVEATSYERFSLWKENEYRIEKEDKLFWNSESSGILYTIGYLNISGKDWPITIEFDFATINDTPICFYYPTSVIVDFKMVETWMKTNFNIEYKGRKNYTNADNFHNCLIYCQEEHNKRRKLEEINKS